MSHPQFPLAAITAELLRTGFCLVKRALDADTVDDLRRLIDRVADEHGVNDDLHRGGRVEWLMDPIELDAGFDWLIHAEPPFGVAQQLFGRDVHIYDVSIRISEPGTPAQEFHRDDTNVPHPMPPLWQQPPILTCFYHLDDAAATAGYEAVPGSHLHTLPAMRGSGATYSADGYTRIGAATTVLPESGDLLLTLGGVLHRGLANESQLRRRVILLSLSPAILRQRATVFRGPRVRQMRVDADPLTALRLGGATTWTALEDYFARAYGEEYRAYGRPPHGLVLDVPPLPTSAPPVPAQPVEVAQ